MAYHGLRSEEEEAHTMDWIRLNHIGIIWQKKCTGPRSLQDSPRVPRRRWCHHGWEGVGLEDLPTLILTPFKGGRGATTRSFGMVHYSLDQEKSLRNSSL